MVGLLFAFMPVLSSKPDDGMDNLEVARLILRCAWSAATYAAHMPAALCVCYHRLLLPTSCTPYHGAPMLDAVSYARVTVTLAVAVGVALLIARTLLSAAVRTLAKHASPELYQLTAIAFCLAAGWIFGHLVSLARHQSCWQSPCNVPRTMCVQALQGHDCRRCADRHGAYMPESHSALDQRSSGSMLVMPASGGITAGYCSK